MNHSVMLSCWALHVINNNGLLLLQASRDLHPIIYDADRYDLWGYYLIIRLTEYKKRIDQIWYPLLIFQTAHLSLGRDT